MLDIAGGSAGGDDSSNAMQFPLLAQSYSISSERYDLLEDNGGGGNKRNHTADLQVTSTLMIENFKNCENLLYLFVCPSLNSGLPGVEGGGLCTPIRGIK